jgi:hypothetical protein
VVGTWPPTGGFAEDDLPAYLAESGEPDGRPPPTMADLWAGARRMTTAAGTALAALPSAASSALTSVPTAGSGPAGGVLPGGPFTTRRPDGSPVAPRELSARFLRLVRLPGVQLAAILDEWWTTMAVGDASTVDRRLRLGLPRGDAYGGWTMTGHVRRLTRWHWVPVDLELWPVHDRWTMVTMTPRARVFATARYFRTGHRVIERLTELLGATSAART